MPSPAPPRRAPSAWDRLGAKWGCGAPPRGGWGARRPPITPLPPPVRAGAPGLGGSPPRAAVCVCVSGFGGGDAWGGTLLGGCSRAPGPAGFIHGLILFFFECPVGVRLCPIPHLLLGPEMPRGGPPPPPPPSSPSVGSGAPGRGRLFYRLSLGVTLFNVQCY